MHKERYNRAQELCESRGGRPGLPVPGKPDCFCGRKATLKKYATSPRGPALIIIVEKRHTDRFGTESDHGACINSHSTDIICHRWVR